MVAQDMCLGDQLQCIDIFLSYLVSRSSILQSKKRPVLRIYIFKTKIAVSSTMLNDLNMLPNITSNCCLRSIPVSPIVVHLYVSRSIFEKECKCHDDDMNLHKLLILQHILTYNNLFTNPIVV